MTDQGDPSTLLASDRQTSRPRRVIEQLARASRYVRHQLESATSEDRLRTLRVSTDPGAANMAAYFNPNDRSIVIDRSVTDTEELNGLAFIVGHELRHALNGPDMERELHAFSQRTRFAAARGLDYTAAMSGILQATRIDEATANIAGWNAYVDTTATLVGHAPTALQLSGHWQADVVLERADSGGAKFRAGYTSTEDMFLAETATSVETMARRFYDRPGALTGLGPLGDSDYLHYYAAWAIGHIGEVHVAYQPYRDEMRRRQGHNPRAAGPLGLDPLALPFENLGIETGQLHRTGIDFGGTQHIPFLDIGTSRTGFLTATDPKRLPPLPLPRPVLDMRERITAPSLDERATPRSATRAPGSRNAQAISGESAVVRARRTTTPRTVARTGTTTRTPRGHDR
ncbi:hypothetical protein F8O01_12790 [Pseudoclavibacter chungangensis]|uniref:Uncharacterized protein n=1 Tax=Pseudoclavibacter chungangensis TaxID=587635 RepID=A0A7J5BP82_9MICO|nr:hypothetical protein [Pseudoclavibacter chungangensis]KAB1654778.1 hypothetical protein F8O01_12790 [Pseudoclavibacter chungangensis]NYJ68116.1 hypothetical protein [Pseudoclavibacter chungangensis]